MLHLVDTFYPLPQSPEDRRQKITPGRIGSVFFFPKASFQLLQGKGPHWARKTAFGRNEYLYAPGTFDLQDDSGDSEDQSPEDEDATVGVEDVGPNLFAPNV